MRHSLKYQVYCMANDIFLCVWHIMKCNQTPISLFIPIFIAACELDERESKKSLKLISANLFLAALGEMETKSDELRSRKLHLMSLKLKL